MSTYSFDKFKNNILNIAATKNSYFFEVMLTDFYCFQNDINPEKIYISKPIGDDGIDAIIIPKNSSDVAINAINILQISIPCKSPKEIEAFLNKDPYNLPEYKKLLDNYSYDKKYNIHKVLITLKHSNAYSKFNTLEIISGDKLFEAIFENSIRYQLTYNKNILKKEYIKNIDERVIFWTQLHRFKNFYEKDGAKNCGKSIIDSFMDFILLNHSSIKVGEFNVVSDVNSIWERSFNDAVSTLQSFDSNIQDNLINCTDNNILLTLMTIFRYGNSLNSDIYNLVKNINTLKESNFFSDEISIEPTIDYLSIKYKDRTIAYLQYVYNKKATSSYKYIKSRFSFKCDFDELLDNRIKLPSLVQNYLNNKRLVSTKQENKNKTGASHTGMSTSLVLPSESDNDWSVIDFLLCKSIDTISQK